MNKSLLFALCLIILVGCGQKKSATEDQAEKNKALNAQVYDYFNTDNWDKLTSLIASDFVDHNPDPGQKQGFDGLKEAFAQMRKAYPDFKITVNHMVAEGDYVCSHVTVTGTNTGEMNGMPPTGKKMSIEGFDLIRISNGKGVERWGVFDTMTMLTQLGMMPQQGQQPPAESNKK